MVTLSAILQGLMGDDSWHVYLAFCADGTLYTGIAKDVEARIELHNSGRGAKYTRSRRPVRLAYSERQQDRASAQRREQAIRRMSRQEKWTLTGMEVDLESIS